MQRIKVTVGVISGYCISKLVVCYIIGKHFVFFWAREIHFCLYEGLVLKVRQVACWLTSNQPKLILFFSYLLPEEALHYYLAERAGVNPTWKFFLLKIKQKLMPQCTFYWPACSWNFQPTTCKWRL